MEGNKTNSGVLAAVGVVIVALIAYGGFKYFKKDTTTTPVETPVTVPAKGEMGDSTSTPIYKDGTYSATGNYNSPGGAEELGVTLTIKNDVVVDAVVVSKAFRPESMQYQGKFVANFKSQVIGKKLADLNLTKVSGSSLTPKGFDDAVAKIKVQAQS
jgi:uncharacterized protein with FMN-binding domain